MQKRDKLKLNEIGNDKLKFYKADLIESNNINRKHLYEVFELLKYQENEKYIEEFSKFKAPKYPLNEMILMKTLSKDNQESGSKRLRKLVHEKLKKIWIDSNFTLSESQLLEYLKNPEFLNECLLEIKNK